MKWFEIPIKTQWKTGTGQNQTVDQKAAVCFDPPMEITQHPAISNHCLLTTGYGTKIVTISYGQLLSKFGGIEAMEGKGEG